jgi:hypothetical protein
MSDAGIVYGQECRGCSASVRVSDAEIDDMIGMLKLRKGESVDGDTWRARLDACASCLQFAYGTTCLQCGCLVRVRALLASGACPHPGGNRWMGPPHRAARNEELGKERHDRR